MSRQPLVLAIEPDLRQAAIVKRVVKERVQADVVVVDSRDAAIAAIGTAIPDVLLLSALLSPRDEDDLIAHLRTLEGASHLQTHTIPQLASALGRGEDGGGGLFSAFRRKKASASAPAGCDPDLFADEVRVYLERAAAKKREAAEAGTLTPLPSIATRLAEKAPVAHEAAPEPAGSSWASPFEWRPTVDRRTAPPPAAPPVKAESVVSDPQSPIADPLPAIPTLESLGLGSSDPEPLIADPEPLNPGPGSLIPDPSPASPKLHVPSPLSVWARKETPKNDAVAVDAEFVAFFARLGVPEGVASVAYPEGVRIRRVRVRAVKEPHPSLQGAMLLGKRMLAELSGSHPA